MERERLAQIRIRQADIVGIDNIRAGGQDIKAEKYRAKNRNKEKERSAEPFFTLGKPPPYYPCKLFVPALPQEPDCSSGLHSLEAFSDPV